MNLAEVVAFFMLKKVVSLVEEELYRFLYIKESRFFSRRRIILLLIKLKKAISLDKEKVEDYFTSCFTLYIYYNLFKSFADHYRYRDDNIVLLVASIINISKHSYFESEVVTMKGTFDSNRLFFL